MNASSPTSSAAPSTAAAPLIRTSQAPDGPAPAAALLEPAMAGAIGEAAAPVSLTLDYGAPLIAGETVTIESWVERATRTLVFVHGRVLKGDGALAATGSAVFRKLDLSAPA
jgi:acyl-coenzyme A thioesterase PaaI-like protein